MPNETLNLNFPVGNPNPFNTDFNGNYFVYANAFSNLSHNLEDFSINKLREAVDMGYATIIIQKRLYVISDGKIKKKCFGLFKKLSGKKFFLTVDKTTQFAIENGNTVIDTHVLYKPNSKDVSLRSSTWDDIQACIEHAIKTSNEQQCQVIISEIIDRIHWH